MTQRFCEARFHTRSEKSLLRSMFMGPRGVHAVQHQPVFCSIKAFVPTRIRTFTRKENSLSLLQSVARLSWAVLACRHRRSATSRSSSTRARLDPNEFFRESRLHWVWLVWLTASKRSIHLIKYSQCSGALNVTVGFCQTSVQFSLSLLL